jgi:hypothetical protein
MFQQTTDFEYWGRRDVTFALAYCIAHLQRADPPAMLRTLSLPSPRGRGIVVVLTSSAISTQQTANSKQQTAGSEQ